MNSSTKKILFFYLLGFTIPFVLPKKQYFQMMNNVYAFIQNSTIRIDHNLYYSLI